MHSPEIHEPISPTPLPPHLNKKIENGFEPNRNEGPKGFLTEQKLLRWFYETFRGVDTNPITTDKFLNKSKDQYNSSWLMRELIQNFVDHNPQDRGTLNGVSFTVVPSGATLRYVLKGNWAFKEPTGVLSPHSEKSEEGESAGGNGIGLKQAAIRLLRDFGVKRFEIRGEGWTAQYRMAKAQEVNAQLQQELAKRGQGPMKELKEDWLLADMTETENTGECAYVLEIENMNYELIEQLQHLMELGVSKDNPYLKDPDFENEKGAIKWLPYTPERSHGRLFLNGQVMNYKENGKTPETYWQGPEFVTLRLNNVKYKMNIDRPPVDSNDLSTYADTLVRSMNKQELIQQLQQAEGLWSNIVDSGYGRERLGCSVIIKKIIERLSSVWDEDLHMKPEEFEQYFGGKQYLAYDRITEAQAGDLRNQGYRLCSEYFEKIGMPRASTKLNQLEVVSNETPKSSYDFRSAQEKMAKEVGITVAYAEYLSKTPGEFIKEILSRVNTALVAFTERSDRPGTFRMGLSAEWSKQLLNHEMARPKDANQKLLHGIRGIALYGLKNKIFSKVYSSQGEYVTTYGVQYDSVTEEDQLLVRNIESRNDGGVFVEFELDPQYHNLMRTVLGEQQGESKKESIEQTTDTITPRKPPEASSPIPDTTPENTHTPKPSLLTEQAIERSAGRSNLKEELTNIPIVHPSPEESDSTHRVVTAKREESTVDREKFEQLAQHIPALEQAIAKIDQAVPTRNDAPEDDDDPVKQYLRWRTSDDFYGQAGDEGGYLTGKSLINILSDSHTADIAAVEQSSTGATPEQRALQLLNRRLAGIIEDATPEDKIVDFEIEVNPEKRELAQLALMRLYIQVVTGAAVPNDLFVYKGAGALGVNIGKKAIGLHKELLNVGFFEAFNTMTHEVAHNAYMNHGLEFVSLMQALFTRSVQRQYEIIQKLDMRQELTTEDHILMDIQNRWRELQQ